MSNKPSRFYLTVPCSSIAPFMDFASIVSRDGVNTLVSIIVCKSIRIPCMNALETSLKTKKGILLIKINGQMCGTLLLISVTWLKKGTKKDCPCEKGRVDAYALAACGRPMQILTVKPGLLTWGSVWEWRWYLECSPSDSTQGRNIVWEMKCCPSCGGVCTRAALCAVCHHLILPVNLAMAGVILSIF